MTLAGRKVFLRPLEASDEEALAVRLPEGAPVFGVAEIKTLRLAGAVWLSRDPEGSEGVARLCVRIRAQSQGKGYATEAGGLLAAHAFEKLKFHRLETRIEPANRAMRKVLKRLGFRYEGRLRSARRSGTRWLDQECWGLLRADKTG